MENVYLKKQKSKEFGTISFLQLVLWILNCSKVLKDF
jgi:hypothetical protein